MISVVPVIPYLLRSICAIMHKPLSLKNSRDSVLDIPIFAILSYTIDIKIAISFFLFFALRRNKIRRQRNDIKIPKKVKKVFTIFFLCGNMYLVEIGLNRFSLEKKQIFPGTGFSDSSELYIIENLFY